MELLQLKYFLEVAKTQHVTQTARRLRVSQPSLTQAIHRLERELGVKLFEPEGRGIRLTEAGALFQKRIARVLADLDAATAELEQFRNQRAEVVRVDVLSASSLVLDAIAEYKRIRPNVRFSIGHAATATADICVNMRESGPVEHCAEERAFSERIMLAMPLDDPELPHDERVSLGKLAERDFIMLAGSKSLTDLCVAQCEKLGFHPATSFESDNPSMVRKMIGLGLGVGFWPEHSWGKPDGTGTRLAPIAEPGFVRTIRLARLSHNEPHPEADRFYEFLVQQFAKRWQE